MWRDRLLWIFREEGTHICRLDNPPAFSQADRVETTPPLMEPSAAVPAATTSLAARMVNVLATPAEVFDEVKNAKPSTANWLVITSLFVSLGWFFAHLSTGFK